MKARVVAVLLMLASWCAAAAPLELTDVDGVRHSLASHRGKWVVLNVWATWCAPCLHEMPELEALARSNNEVVVLGLAADEQDARVVRAFAQRLHVTYPVIAANREALRQLAIRAYPTTLIYDREGKQVALKEGKISRQEIDAVIGRKPAAP